LEPFNNGWDVLQEEFALPYYRKLRIMLTAEYRAHTVYPDMHDIYAALRLTGFDDARCVILGQDPYHGPGQAHGLAFSVRPGVEIPPSLRNIYAEIHDDLGLPIPTTGCLIPWARQGVLLLNSCLTVRAGQAGSHRPLGWETLTDSIIARLGRREKPLVFLLWGNFAKAKVPLIENPRHLILTAPHPSPLSARYGFFGCKHFSQANAFLMQNGDAPIDWRVPAENTTNTTNTPEATPC
jgi:uracil-DNA glycosylase